MSTRGSSRFLLSLASELSALVFCFLFGIKTLSPVKPAPVLERHIIQDGRRCTSPPSEKTVDTWFFWLMSQRYYFNILCWRRRFLSRKFLCQVALTRQLVRSPPSTSCFCSSAGALHNISDTTGRHRSQADFDVGQPPWRLLVSRSLRFRYQRRPEPSAPNSSCCEILSAGGAFPPLKSEEPRTRLTLSQLLTTGSAVTVLAH